MRQFTINIEDEQIEKFIKNMLNLIKNTPGIEFQKDGDSYTFKSNKTGNKAILTEDQFTWEQLINEINLSEKDFKNGNYMTSDQLKNEVKSW